VVQAALRHDRAHISRTGERPGGCTGVAISCLSPIAYGLSPLTNSFHSFSRSAESFANTSS
jgi:hypothetical protein